MFRRKQRAPSIDHDPDGARYDGKPFLRVLECYVLWAVGELDADDEARLRAMEPKLAEVYGRPGASWVEIVEAEMAFPATLRGSLAGLWRENVAVLHEHGVAPDAEAWARSVVDENFT